MTVNDLITIARGELGYTESPANSNKTKYGVEYGTNGVPWCVEWLWWCFKHAGMSDLFYGGKKTASCTALRDFSIGQGEWFTDGTYKVGDIAIMTFATNRAVQHCGLIVEVLGNGKYRTIEGNTSPGEEGSQNNGGCVALKVRSTSNILGVCRPAYPGEVPDDCKGRWSESDIAFAFQNGIMGGYPDGTWKPTKEVTREELAVVIRRVVKYVSGKN